VRDVVVPFEQDPRRDHHGAPTDDLVQDMRALARQAGVLTPHVLPDGGHLTQRETALVLTASGLSPLGPLACNTAAPDEGNMYLLGKVGSPDIKARFLAPLVSGHARSAFFMTEPAEMGGAGSDPCNCSGSLFPRRSSDLARLRWSGWQGYRRTGECKADGVDGADGSASTCFHG